MSTRPPSPLPQLALACCALFALSCSGGPSDSAEGPRQASPNLLLVTLDTTRADHLGCYGYAQPLTPNIDRLAARSTIFLNASSSASTTPVSHASIFTGQFPYKHGLRVLHGRDQYRLPDEAVTLAEVLRDRGYRTAAFVSAFPAGSRFGLDQGFEVFNEDYMRTPVDRIVSPRGVVFTGRNQQHAGRTTDLALDWLDRAGEPFFLWLHYFDPHDARVVPPDEFLQQHLPVPKGRREALRAMYDIEIRYMDQQFGRVLDFLEASGQLDETVVVVVSDHGEGLGDHAWWTHGLLYQEQIRVALVVHAPKRTATARLHHLVRTVDLLPTLIELLAVDPAALPNIDGESLVTLLADGSPDPGHVAYADSLALIGYAVFGFPRGSTDRKTDVLYAVNDGRWKYIHHFLREADSELYDLVADPGERHNLYASRPAEAERLLRELRSRLVASSPRRPPDPMSKEDKERLRSLGYVD